MKSTLRTDFSEVKSVFGFRVRLGNPDLDFENLIQISQSNAPLVKRKRTNWKSFQAKLCPMSLLDFGFNFDIRRSSFHNLASLLIISIYVLYIFGTIVSRVTPFDIFKMHANTASVWLTNYAGPIAAFSWYQRIFNSLELGNF